MTAAAVATQSSAAMDVDHVHNSRSNSSSSASNAVTTGGGTLIHSPAVMHATAASGLHSASASQPTTATASPGQCEICFSNEVSICAYQLCHAPSRSAGVS